jgi:hypothetical protein
MNLKPTLHPRVKKLSLDQTKDDGIDVSESADQEHVRNAKN